MISAGLSTLAAPASALSVTIPPALLAPLPPIQLPVGDSVSAGTGGASTDVSVTVPDGAGIDVHLPGIPTVPALPIGPTGPVSGPNPIPSPPPVLAPGPTPLTPAPPAWPAPRVGSDPRVAVPGSKAATRAPAAPPASPATETAPRAHPGAAASAPRRANVSATIDARPADSLLHRVPMIASRVALWAALAAIVLVLQLLVGGAVRQRRRKTPRVS